MDVMYFLAVWIHILTASFWIGAMFFGDPESTRFFSTLFERKLGGVGWYAQTVLWITGIYLLAYRGVTLAQLFSLEFVSNAYIRAVWIKILFVLILGGFQLTIGHKPSKLVYGYILVAFAAVAMGVQLVRGPLF
jgi:hypothetical protein